MTAKWVRRVQLLEDFTCDLKLFLGAIFPDYELSGRGR